MTDAASPKLARNALLVLLAINLFNYIDRQVLSAVLPRIQADGSILSPDDPNAQFKLGLLTSAFMATYMLLSPLFGWLDGHGYRRWVILGVGVTLWSLASGASGLATGYSILLLTRCLVGVGEAAYAPVASAMLSDLYPVDKRGKVLAYFNVAIPVGSALGFIVGGLVADLTGDWRPAFYVTFSGLLLGVVCFLMPEPPRPAVAPGAARFDYRATLRELLRSRSFVLNCLAMTAITFVVGGVAAWVPTYIYQREARFQLTAEALAKLETTDDPAAHPSLPPEVMAKMPPPGPVQTYPELRAVLAETLNKDEAAKFAETIYARAKTPDSPGLGKLNFLFGVITVVGGIAATLTGMVLGERLRGRVRGAYCWVSGVGVFLALPFYVAMLYVPFPLAWLMLFGAIFGLFLYTGPANTLLANVCRTDMRATAFAVNILVIHALGDVISPPIIGAVADAVSLHAAFLALSAFIVLGGVLWIAGVPFEDEETRRAEEAVR